VLPASLLQSFQVGVVVIIPTQAPDHVTSETLSLQGIAGLPHTLTVLPGPESGIFDLGIEESGSLSNGVVVVDVVERNIVERLHGVFIGGRCASGHLDIVSLGRKVVLGLESESARSTTINRSARCVVGCSVTSFCGAGVQLHGVEFASAGVLDSVAGVRVLDVEPLGVAVKGKDRVSETASCYNGAMCIVRPTRRIRHSYPLSGDHKQGRSKQQPISKSRSRRNGDLLATSIDS